MIPHILILTQYIKSWHWLSTCRPSSWQWIGNKKLNISQPTNCQWWSGLMKIVWINLPLYHVGIFNEWLTVHFGFRCILSTAKKEQQFETSRCLNLMLSFVRKICSQYYHSYIKLIIYEHGTGNHFMDLHRLDISSQVSPEIFLKHWWG